ncbi:MAG: response regulator, partial [Pseudomonadota bacterium]
VHFSASAKPGERDGELILQLAVSDTGPGIAESETKLIFEPFRRSEGISARKVAGNGLGLSLVSRLTAHLNGTVGVTSVVGQGSCFTVELPVATAPVETLQASLLHINIVAMHGPGRALEPALKAVSSKVVEQDGTDLEGLRAVLDSRRHNVVLVDGQQLAHNANAARLHQRLQNLYYDVSFVAVSNQLRPKLRQLPDALSWLACLERENLESDLSACLQLTDRAVSQFCEDVDKLGLWVEQPLRILVAEDNLLNQNVVRAMLQRLGHVSHIVPDGAASLDALLEDHYDLVLMDVNMPVMDGIEATKSIRAFSGSLARTKIFGLTADASTLNLQECLAAGMDGCLTKPLRAHELNDVCRTIAKTQKAVPGESAALAAQNMFSAPSAIHQPSVAAHSPQPGDLNAHAIGGANVDMLAELPAMMDRPSFAPPVAGATFETPVRRNISWEAPGSPTQRAHGGDALEDRVTRGAQAQQPASAVADNIDDISVDFEVLDEVIATAGLGALPNFLDLLSTLLDEQTSIIIDGIRDDDHAAIGAALHKLRGGAATVGAREITKAICRAEQALRNGKRDPSENFAIDSDRLYERFSAALQRRYFDASVGTGTPGAPVHPGSRALSS